MKTDLRIGLSLIHQQKTASSSGKQPENSARDSQDWIVANDSSPEISLTPIFAAYGDDDSLAFHGNNSFKGKIRFFREVDDAMEQFLLDMATEGATWKEFTAPSTYVIPSKPTKHFA